jgi:hypothetical protein
MPQFQSFKILDWLPTKTPPNEVIDFIASLPTRTFNTLLHRGDPKKHKPNSDSHEGCLLSVSEDPDAWGGIARCLKGESWQLSLPNSPLILVDCHRLKVRSKKAPSWAKLRQLAVALELVRPITGYRVSWYDDECDDTRFFEFTNKAEAVKELDEDRILKTVQLYVALPTLAAYWTLRHKQKIETHDTNDAALAYLGEWCSLHHGLWWNDLYDPSQLSCPRGGIFQSVVSKLEITSE